MMSFAARRLFFATIVVLFAAAAHAQTDYFWNITSTTPTGGGTGNWDTSNPMWSTGATTPNNYTWLNDGTERANFGITAGTVTLAVPITAYGINFSTANYVIAGGGNALTLSGTGGVINSNVTATITAPIAGLVGLTKIGSGTLTLSGANTYSGTTTVTGSTLIGNPQASGSPFSSGPVTLNGAILNLKTSIPSISTTTTVGDLTVSAANANTVGASNLIVDNSIAGASNTTTLAAGNLVRGGSGSALVVTPATGFLGTRERISLTNGSSLLTNGILPPWVISNPTAGSTAGDFVTYGAGPGDWNHDGSVNGADYVTWRKDPADNGGDPGGYNTWRQNFGNSGSSVNVATYFSGTLATSTNTSVVNQSSAITLSGAAAAYALKTNQAINLGTNTLTLGNGSGQSGLILNTGAAITNGNISFGSTEGMVYSQGTTTLGSAGNTITSNGLSMTALGLTNMTINSNINNGASPSQVTFTGITSGTSLTLNGANGYTGGTVLSVNTSTTGNVFIGNDSAFGTGKVTNIIVPGTSSDQFQASGGARTLANAFDLNGGLTFTGTNSLSFTGPINIINAASGGTRTLQNSMNTNSTGTPDVVTFGSSVTPSTITLGNPVANGGDGVGKGLSFVVNVAGAVNTLNSKIVINDVMQDPAAGGGTASGSVTYGSTGSGTGQVGTGTYVINSQSTYSGTTTLNGNNQVTIQFSTDTVGDSPNITKGPFGIGTLLFNNTSNDSMQPFGGGTRTISNPITLNFGYTFNNASGDTTSALLTGPITMLAAGRTLTNAMSTSATLTLGSSTTPSTLTLPTATGTTTAIAGAGNTTINDVIQEVPASGNVSNVTISAGGGTGTAPSPTILLNGMNTYAGTTNFNGAGTLIPIVNSTTGTPGAITAGPFGTGTLNFNNGTNQHLRPIGGDKTIGNAITMTTGFAMDNSATDASNLTFSGAINMTNNNGRTISNGFSSPTLGGTLFIGDPASPNVITLGNFTNTGTPPSLSWGAWAGPIIVSDTIVNPATVTAAYSVNINPTTGQNFPVRFNNAGSTYTGGTTVGGGGTGAVELGVDTVGGPGAVTSGPLGTGPVTATGTSAEPLAPYGADRTLANDITLNGNLGAASATGLPFNLNLTGSISLGTTGRSIVNNMSAGTTLTLGQSTPAASTSAISLSQTAAQALTFNGSSTSTTVVNDVIANNFGGNPGNVSVAGSIVNFNNANSYGATSAVGTTVSGGTLLVNNTSGSGTGLGDVSVTGGSLGGNGTISGSVSLSGGAIAPGNSAGTLNVGGNVTFSTGTAAFTVELGGTSPGTDFDQLLVGGTTDLTAGGTLNVSLINGFNPIVNTDFTVLTATGGLILGGGGSGFTNVTYPDFTHWTTTYTANSVVVHYTASPGAGALNGGGAVPEPGSLVLLICAIGSVLASIRPIRRIRN